ncbi:2908_t:CDS:2, partial [Ambispora gerdemannii]
MSNSTFTLHPSKTAMDTRNDLEMHQTNGEEERESGTSTIQVRKIAVNDALSASENNLKAYRNIRKGKQAGTSSLHNFPSTIQ